ncbi:unnamed protein product [Symbiodinium sp. KB8]|nr:unnamed protein product [Symbiodinium sp. KB8]
MDPSTLQLPEKWEFVHDEHSGLVSHLAAAFPLVLRAVVGPQRYYYNGNVGVSQWTPPAAAKTKDGRELTAEQIAELSFSPAATGDPAEAAPRGAESKQESPVAQPGDSSPAVILEGPSEAAAGVASDGNPEEHGGVSSAIGAAAQAAATSECAGSTASFRHEATEPGKTGGETKPPSEGEVEAQSPVAVDDEPLGAADPLALARLPSTAAVIYRDSSGQAWVTLAEADRLKPLTRQMGLSLEGPAKLITTTTATEVPAEPSSPLGAMSSEAGHFARAFDDSCDEGDDESPSDEEEEAPAIAEAEVPERLRFRAIIKLDGTVFYQSLFDRATSWELPPGGVVVERARQKPPAMPLMALRAVAKFKRLGKAAAQAKAAAKAAAVRRSISGWLHKTRDMTKGSAPRWRKRFVELDWDNKKLRYYSKDPSVTLQRYGVQEPQKGELDLTGARLVLTSSPPPGGPGKAGIEVLAGERRTFLSQPDDIGRREASLKLWMRVVQGAIDDTSASAAADPTSPAAALQRRARSGARDKVAAMADAAFAFQAAAAHAVCHISWDGHRWIRVRASVRVGPRMLLLMPTEELGLEMQLPGATITTSLSLQGAIIESDSKLSGSSRNVVVSVTDAQDSARPIKLMLPQTLATATFLAAMEAVSELRPPRPDVLREVLGGDQGEGAVVQVEGWKTNSNGVGWRPRRIQLSLDGKFFRYLLPADAAAADSSELGDSLAKNVVELDGVEASELRVLAGTGHGSMPPAPLALRVVVKARVYTFCCATDEDFAELFSGFSLVAAAKAAKSPLAHLQAAAAAAAESSAAAPVDPDLAERETRAALGSVAALEEAVSAVDAARQLVAEAGRVISSAGSSRVVSPRGSATSAGSSTAEGSQIPTPTQTENPAFAIKALLATPSHPGKGASASATRSEAVAHGATAPLLEASTKIA